MNTRKRIGLLLTYDYSWAGGVYYIINIIRSLKFLDDEKRPEVVIFYSYNTPPDALNQIDYPYCTLVNLSGSNLIRRIQYKLYNIFFNPNYQLEYLVNAHRLHAFYPLIGYSSLDLNCRAVYWIYDLQHKFLPELFSKEDLKNRDAQFGKISYYADRIVFSSNDSLNKFRMFYPESKASLFVLQFVSVINKNEIAEFEEVRKKYNIERPFFIVANQFWQHKNHIAVLRALTLVRTTFPEVLIVFTGKQFDHRNKLYVNTLLDFVKQESLDRHVIFTGFISRSEQLSIMKNSIAVIQPSRFEGWSTVVEDAKTLGKPVIASDISVHREQLDANPYLFAPDDFRHLATIMKKMLQNGAEFAGNNDYDYLYRVRRFAGDFLSIFH